MWNWILIPNVKVPTMKLPNPLKSLNWNSLVWRPGRRLRRRSPGFAPAGYFGAEVLEQRQLLSGTPNVNLTVVAGAITLTSTDSNDASVDVHRVDPTNVEVDAFNSTQITYKGIVHTTSFYVAS